MRLRTPHSCSLLSLLLSAVLTPILAAQAPLQTPAPAPAPQAPPPAIATPVNKDPNGVYTLRRTARLVILDVVVTDAKGNLVTDLQRDDFRVTEAKEPQTILTFEQTGAHTAAPDLTINSTADLDRVAPRTPVNIILLDEFNTRFEDMAFARYSLKKFLQKQPDKLTMPAMLVAVDLQHFTVLRDYTQSKTELISALDHHFAANPWRNTNRSWAPERFSTAFGTLMRVAQATVGHPGHKNMMWIGRGFPSLNLIGLPVDATQRVDNAVQECVNALRDARVTLYSVDPAGVLIDPGVYGSSTTAGVTVADDPFGGNYQFNRLARATGGRALYGRNDVDAEIGTAVRDGANFYTLTYRPSTESLDPQKFRKIQVTLSRPGLTATTREGYYLELPPATINPEKPSNRLAFDLLSAAGSNITYDGVPISITPSTNDPYKFTVHVDARALSWSPATETEPRSAEIVLMTSTFDKKGNELHRSAKSIRASAGPDVPPTGRLDRYMDVITRLEPDPKATHARFVVRVSSTGRIGTADYTFGQPQTAKPQTAAGTAK